MRVDTAHLVHDAYDGDSSGRAHHISHPTTGEELSFNIAAESDFTERTLRNIVMEYEADKIGEWNKSEFSLYDNFAEVKQVVVRRGAQKMTISSAQWAKSGEGNNLVLVRFPDEGFFLGEVQTMFTCTNQFGRDRRLLFDMELKEVHPVTMNYKRQGRTVYRTVLENLLTPPIRPKKERHLCSITSIGKKMMLCKIKNKVFYAPYP